MKITYVSSCLLKKSNKVLITSRPKGKFLSGFWEIPGGKLFNNESFEDCAVRELYEEIGVYINKEDLKNIDLVTHRYKNNIINITKITCKTVITICKTLSEVTWGTSRHSSSDP